MHDCATIPYNCDCASRSSPNPRQGDVHGSTYPQPCVAIKMEDTLKTRCIQVGVTGSPERSEVDRRGMHSPALPIEVEQNRF